MPFNCPICHKEITVAQDRMFCDGGHQFVKNQGVYPLMKNDFKQTLNEYLEAFENYRNESHNHINEENVNSLPYVSFDTSVWKLRTYDLSVLSKIFSDKKGLSVLDIGAWNGWLSHQLAAQGHSVTALDYFMAPFDGLQTVSFYRDPFLALQTNLNDLSFLKPEYDVIVINRCYPYFEAPEKTIAFLKTLLSDNGIIIITGLNSFKNPSRIIEQMKTSDDAFKSKYGKSLYICNFKGYTDASDLEQLRKNGFRLKLYPQLLFKSLLSILLTNKPAYWYAVYKNNRNS